MIENMTLFDDLFFAVCMDDNCEAMSLILSVITGRPVFIVSCESQLRLINMVKRSLNHDVISRDANGTIYNVEAKRKKLKSRYKRSRYHKSSIDHHSLDKGKVFEFIPDLHIEFINQNDQFGDGLPLHKFITFDETVQRRVPDGLTEWQVNGQYQAKDPVGMLMHDFRCKNPQRINYNVLKETVSHYKNTEKGIQFMCETLEGMRKKYERIGEKKGFKKGEIRSRYKIASRMLKENYPPKEIADLTALSVKEIKLMEQKMIRIS